MRTEEVKLKDKSYLYSWLQIHLSNGRESYVNKSRTLLQLIQIKNEFIIIELVKFKYMLEEF